MARAKFDSRHSPSLGMSMNPLRGESDERNDAHGRRYWKPAAGCPEADHCMDREQRAGNAQERLAKRESRRQRENRIASTAEDAEMNGESTEHRKPPLYWLTLTLIYAAFVAGILL